MKLLKKLCWFMFGILMILFFQTNITMIAQAKQIPTSGKYFDINWVYNASKQTLTITGTGEMYDYVGGDNMYDECPWWDIDGIKRVIIGEGITHIGNDAFSSCPDIISVKFPKSLKSIGESAFSGCSNLKKVKLPNGLISIGCFAFADCSMKSIVLPNGLKKIGAGAFSETKLDKIEIPDSVTWIGEVVFDDCKNLRTVKLSKKLKKIPYGTFRDCIQLKSITIPSSVTTIGASAFEGTSLTSITIPKGVKCLKGEIFKDCLELKKITVKSIQLASVSPDVLKGVDSTATIVLPKSKKMEYKKYFTPNTSGTFRGIKWRYDGITKTLYFSGDGAMTDEDFYFGPTNQQHDVYNYSEYPWYDWGDYATSVVINEGITSIGNGTCYSFSRIKSVSLPSSLKKIGKDAFLCCECVNRIDIPEGVTNIGNSAFVGCTSLKEITIPNSLTSVDDYAFGYCESLTDIVIPDGVTHLGKELFYSCTDLQNVKLPSNLNCIPVGLLEHCQNMKKLEIPESVTQIGEAAFWDSGIEILVIPRNVESLEKGIVKECKNLKKIIIQSEKLKTLASETFNDVSKEVTIEAPINKADTYPAIFERAGLNPEVKVEYQ